MKIISKVEVVANVQITSREAELIADVAGGEFVAWYEEKYGKRYGSNETAAEITKVLASIRAQCQRIVKAVKDANDKLFEDLR